MIKILRPSGFRSRELPSRSSSGRRCTQTLAAPTQPPSQGSTTRLQSAPFTPHWTLLMAGGFTQLSVNSGDGAVPPLGDTLDCPLVLGHKPRWPYCKGLHARLASHKVAWQPPQDEQLDGLGDPPVQGQVCRPPIQKPRDGSTNLLTPRTE
jgi:hypothetical protein